MDYQNEAVRRTTNENNKPPASVNFRAEMETEREMNDFKNLTWKDIEEMGHDAIKSGEKWKVRALVYLLICRIGEKSDDFFNGTAQHDELPKNCRIDYDKVESYLKGSVFYGNSNKRKSRVDGNNGGRNKYKQDYYNTGTNS